MMRSRISAPVVAVLPAAFVVPDVRVARATEKDVLPFVSPIFGDHMMLQREKPNRLGGWSDAGREIRVDIAGRVTTTTVAADGAEEVAHADHPQIRLFRLTQRASYGPAAAPQGAWKIFAPQSFALTRGGGFFAVAHFFGRKLQEELHVPIDLIQDCIGGTPAETWMNPETLRRLPEFVPALAEIDRLKVRDGPEYGNFIMHWHDEYDRGLQGATWAVPDFDDSAWKTVTIPGGFAELGVPDTPAVCWFRREITLPDPLPAGAAKIYPGVVEKMDTTQINGRWVGASSWVENPRACTIGNGVLRPGRNLVSVRVFKVKRDGGFQSPVATLRLVLGAGTMIPLAGAWKGAVSVDARIEGNSVVVSSLEVEKPVAVRYAWQANPLATLFNGAGLPAVPFRSDDWPLRTEDAK